ncbi:MAG: ABC transporter permease [Rhodoferax sp.]|uniref:ABC transporter permease n=1 Tax=Rhodoferax sp. TaxID=50421 RepID=UPI002730BAF8|nr:ABC transporter permease [Rhodoferax sp.]MDP1529673.1 ABC transporter permease [Rhodoferax sp.]MDP1945348.1 ABC transporter permease [Rhodoferax sp.]
MLDLLKTFSWQELRHHPWRNAAAVMAVMLGVALAFSVHLINASALDEFSQAARSVSGQPDLELRGVQGQFDEALFARVARLPEVALASPVLEVGTYALLPEGKRSLQVVGVDALVVAFVAPDLMPLPARRGDQTAPDRYALFAPGQVFLNPAALALAGARLQLQSGLEPVTVSVAGSVRASGRALAVMDLGAAQELFGKQGQLSRIDLRLKAGVNRDDFVRSLASAPDWPANLSLTVPGDAQSQINKLSRAYRVNLTVLAFIALFTGAFLVFSVLSLSVAKRAQQFALLGVLGLSGHKRLSLVLWESLFLGLLGSAVGIALGTALAALALKWLGGDLGGGFFAGSAPRLQFSAWAALLYGAMGVAAALVGGWWPARAAQALPPAQTLKGLGGGRVNPHSHWLSLMLILLGAALTQAPPLWGIPVAAYVSVALLLVGGITALPWLIGLLLDRLAPLVARQTLPLLAVARARHQRETAAVAVSGVVASLSLAVALTVMVASFRESVTQWLEQVLPADLYVRSAGNLNASDTVYFSPEYVQAAAALKGVKQLQAQRVLPLLLQASLPPVALLARDMSDPAKNLPMVNAPLPVPAGQIGIYVSEAVVDLHGAVSGQAFAPMGKAFKPLAHAGQAPDATYFVAGVWRDYARQTGAIAIDKAAFERLTGDQRANDLALWLTQPADAPQVQAALRALADGTGSGSGELMEFGTPGQIRATSLRIFDRSFAVTYWLQAVAIAIGLFGVAASFSAQVLARRKEFGLLAHLGLTRRQILTVVAFEGAAWTLLGALAGLALGLVVSGVLVHVVNPQSFHWTMDLMLPWLKLLGLCLAVVVAGTLTAWLAAQAAAGQDAVLAVKEDW